MYKCGIFQISEKILMKITFFNLERCYNNYPF
jgi:hypothetical protein